MSNTRSMLEIIYRKIHPEYVIANLIKPLDTDSVFMPKKFMHSGFAWEDFHRPARAHLNYYSTDQLKALLKRLNVDVYHYWKQEPEMPTELVKIEQLNVFQLLNRYSQKILMESENGGVVCNFKNILGWREISHLLGEDIFTTSFLAEMDYKHSRVRKNFSWPAIIKTNNLRLNNIFKRGLADNHFHLNASNPVFDLKWVFMMNHIFDGTKKKIRNALDEYDKDFLSGVLETSHTKNRLTLYELSYIAAVLRVMLYKWVNNESAYFFSHEVNVKDMGEYQKKDAFLVNERAHLIRLLHFDSAFSEPDFDREISDYINRTSWIYGKKSIDYAMPLDFVGEEQHFLDGERKLMYLIFMRSFLNKAENHEMLEFFYLYQLIKIRIRSEIIQVNPYYGFDNFSRYEKRKDDMFYHLPHSRLYRYYYAINNLFKNENVRSLELRIVPNDNLSDLVRKINEIEKVVKMNYHPSTTELKSDVVILNDNGRLAFRCKEEIPAHIQVIHDERSKLKFWHDDVHAASQLEYDNLAHSQKKSVFYVLHFPKVPDSMDEKLIRLYKKYNEYGNVESMVLERVLKDSVIGCRHNQYRKDLMKVASVIVKLRETNLEVARKIYGIDACSNELICRPEVFAPVYRYLSNHRPLKESILESDTNLHCLRMTYHVGEDFYDIVDGLRAIDEAVLFLQLGDGSRIGHALALGTNARKWYTDKRDTIVLPIQNMIDNIAWMYSRIRKYGLEGFTPLCERLEVDFERYYNRVYGVNKEDNISIRTYFDSWKLRGHDPSLIEPLNASEVANDYDMEFRFQKNNLIFCEYDNYLRNPVYGGHSSHSVRKLYYRYHFDVKARVMGTRTISYEIKDDYIAAVEKLQLVMRKEIADRNIGIETNPTSNLLIGNLSRYDEHPIRIFYNLGLERENNVQNFVSINTDDKGVFNTCIENEYALLARSLETKTNDDGSPMYSQAQIFEWLENIRVMGLEQSFKPV